MRTIYLIAQLAVFVLTVRAHNTILIEEGIITDHSKLEYKDRTQNARQFEWAGVNPISHFALNLENIRRDQVRINGGVGSFHIQIFPQNGSEYLNGFVTIHSDRLNHSTHAIGRMRPDSVHLTTQRFSHGDLIEGVFQYIVEPFIDIQYLIDVVRCFALADNEGELAFQKIRYIHFWIGFTLANEHTTVDYQCEFFGQTVRRPPTQAEFFIGYRYVEDRIARTRYADVESGTFARVEFQTVNPISAIEVLNVRSNEQVFSRLVDGAVGGHSVAVEFMAHQNERILFVVIAYEIPEVSGSMQIDEKQP